MIETRALLASFRAVPSQFVVGHFETTGLPEYGHYPGVLAMGFAVVSDGKVIDSENHLVNSGLPIEPEAYQVHGISESGQTAFSKLPELWRVMGGYLDDSFFLAHNLPFYLTVLNAEAQRYELEIPSIKDAFCSQAALQAYGMACLGGGPHGTGFRQAFGHFVGYDAPAQDDARYDASKDAVMIAETVIQIQHLVGAS